MAIFYRLCELIHHFQTDTFWHLWNKWSSQVTNIPQPESRTLTDFIAKSYCQYAPTNKILLSNWIQTNGILAEKLLCYRHSKSWGWAELRAEISKDERRSLDMSWDEKIIEDLRRAEMSQGEVSQDEIRWDEQRWAERNNFNLQFLTEIS